MITESAVLDRTSKIIGRKNRGEEKEMLVELDEEDLQELKARGYEILDDVGEGHTRTAYLARYERGGAVKTRTIKIPKREADAISVCTLINRSKRNVDLVELITSNGIQHPYITEVVDSFNLRDGRTVNVEAYHQGPNLEHFVRNSGRLVEEDRFRKLFSQAIEAFFYLNEEKRILHRDIKPSNIIVLNSSGDIKITDLQNAAKIYDIEAVNMPTRGGTAYTYPELINALVSGRPDRASTRTEVYALGATMFYALTGEEPFNYKVVFDPEGREIQIGDKTFRVKLKDGDRDLEGISSEYHEDRLREKIKKVPKRYRDLVYRCLTTSDKKAISDMTRLKREFDRVGTGYLTRVKEGIAKGMKYVVPSIAATCLGGLIAFGIVNNANKEEKPTLAEILRKTDYRNFSIESSLEGAERPYVLDVLVPYIEEARKKLPQIEAGEIEGVKGDRFLRNMSQFGNNVHLMSPRLISSWLRACYIYKDEAKDEYERMGEERIAPVFVPKNFALRNSMMHGPPTNDHEAVAQGIMYLKQCMGPDKKVADVFADYFCSREDVNTARVRTHSVDFLPSIVDKGEVRIGFGGFLPYRQKRLVEMATALYVITDEQGNIDFSKIP